MALFEIAVEKTLLQEGGFNHIERTGEIVNYGVTLAFLTSAGIKADEAFVRSMTRDYAVGIYLNHFWSPLHLDRLIDQDLADKTFDLAVNCGAMIGAMMLQKAAIAAGGAIEADGYLGPLSLNAVNSLPPAEVYKALIATAERHYRDIATKHPELASDLPMWLARLAKR